MRRDFYLASLLSILLCGYVATFSTSDIEESTKISYSVATGDSGSTRSVGPREMGTFSHLGIPLYDALQGTGNRLPFQASWAQSPEWPLRFLLDKQQYGLLRVFLASLVLLLAGFRALRSWCPRSNLAAIVLFGLLLLVPAGPYLRQNEWPGTFSQTAGILGIAFLLLQRGNLARGEPSNRSLVASPSDFLILFGGVNQIVAGHPGVFPNAALVLAPLLASCLVTSQQFRQQFVRTIKNHRVQLALVIIPALLLVTVVGWELVSESSELQDWSDERLATAQGFYADQALRGISRGILPDVVERTASVIIAMVLLPLICLTFHWLPEFDFTLRMSGAFPRGEFAGALALLIVFRLGHSLATESPERALKRVFIITQFAVVAGSVAAANDWLPVSLIPSAAWASFPILLGLNVLLTFVVLGQTHRSQWVTRVLGYGNIGVVGIWVLMQFSFLSIHPSPRLEIPDRYAQVELSTQDAQQLEDVVSNSERMVFLKSDDYSSQLNRTEVVKLNQRGKSVLAPADAKMRNVSQLSRHNFSDGNVPILSVDRADVLQLDQLLSFLQVSQAMIESRDPLASDVSRTLKSWNQGQSRQDSMQDVTFVGLDFRLWTRTSFASALLPEETNFGPSRCAVLEQDCVVIQQSVMSQSSKSAHLRVCEDPCLWRYRYEGITNKGILVLPLSFDTALNVRNPQESTLETVNVGGFLGVRNLEDSQKGVLQISVQPDARMYARIVSSYMQLGALLVLGLFAVRGCKNETRSRRRLMATNASSTTDERRLGADE